jgi:hypothetical protein
VDLAVTAVSAGGALTVLLSKDGFLSALARVLEKYVESRKAEVMIETRKGGRSGSKARPAKSRPS